MRAVLQGNGFDEDDVLKELTLDFLEEHLKGSSSGGGGGGPRAHHPWPSSRSLKLCSAGL